MEIVLKRIEKGHKSIISEFINEQGYKFAYGLEDNKDIFPEGYYELKIRRVISPLTQVYRDRYDYFQYHIEIIGVEGRRYLYIHVGNGVDDTEGCVLIGNRKGTDYIYESRLAFEAFYKKYYSILESGEKVFISVENCY